MRKKPMLTMLSTAVFTAAAAMSVPTSVVFAAPSGAASKLVQPSSNGVYIVRLADAPVASYDGRIKGYAATKPAAGVRLDSSSPNVQSYRSYLSAKQDEALAKVNGRKIYGYYTAFNGMAAELTEAQAEKLASIPGVLAVSKDELHVADTSSTPDFLGLTATDGLWKQLGGANNAGKDVVVGIIDSGIWPENPSFNYYNKDDGDHDNGVIPGWTGTCVDGEAFDGKKACNGKLIGARYYNSGYGGNAGIDSTRPWEFNSPRDYHGHGSHTAGTAAGNEMVPVTGPGAAFGKVSGMAPRARIAAYKALWSTRTADTANGFTSDLVAAIDQAVADGVDVINYSISGSTTNFRDPVEIAFLFAADAGVFVAASAGNSGPTASTVAHPSPWITTVAAGTHNRSITGSVTTGNGTTYSGASLAAGPVTAPLINAADAALPGADPTRVRLCYAKVDNNGAAVLDPAKVAGKIVVCDRGVTARVNKSLAVAEAGGVGSILINPTANSLNADFHSVPTVHLQNTDYTAVHTYAALAGATATINKAVFTYTAPAPFTASFSSRGPLAASADLLKPDLIAPGQDILAAYTPVLGGLDFNLLSGTSMSAPHVAGLAALLKDKYPKWTPMMIKSALMTTGYDVLDGSSTSPSVIFSQGAGHVAPNRSVDPGLVFDSSFADWLGFLCGTQLPASNCTSAGVPVLDPSDFNAPSIAIGDVPGAQTVTRTVTNVGGRGTYSVSVTGLAGMTVSVTPATFTLNTGQKQKLQIRIQRTTAPLSSYTGGYVTWSDGTHNVRIPVVVRPVVFGAPAQVSGSYSVSFGYDGPFTATPRGLVPAAITAGTVADDPTDGDCSLTAPNAQLIPVTIPVGTTYARYSLFDADVKAGSDLDMCVFSGASLVGSSGSSTSAEEVSFRFTTPPAAALNLTVVVQGWGVAGSTPFKLHAWTLGTAAAGNMTVTAPATATTGEIGNIGLTFNGLLSGTKYLGSIVYGGTAGLPNPTIVRVDAP